MIGDGTLCTGEGTVKWPWIDDKVQTHMYMLENCRYYQNIQLAFCHKLNLGSKCKTNIMEHVSCWAYIPKSFIGMTENIA